jgi:hypothetical protein
MNYVYIALPAFVVARWNTFSKFASRFALICPDSGKIYKVKRGVTSRRRTWQSSLLWDTSVKVEHKLLVVYVPPWGQLRHQPSWEGREQDLKIFSLKLKVKWTFKHEQAIVGLPLRKLQVSGWEERKSFQCRYDEVSVGVGRVSAEVSPRLRITSKKLLKVLTYQSNLTSTQRQTVKWGCRIIW